MRDFATVWACFILAALPYGYIWMRSLAAPSAREMLPWLAISLFASLVGLVLTALSWRRLRWLAVVLAIPFALPIGCSVVAGRDGLDEKANEDAIIFCGLERRKGATPIPSHDERYRKRLDVDGDGLACEAPTNL